MNFNKNNLFLEFNKLNLVGGIFWAVIWVLILLVLGNQPFWSALMSGFSFFIFWIIISIILIISCEYYKFCI